MDGYSGFIMLDKNGNPKVALHIENEMRWAVKKYKKLHPDSPLPHILPHVCRHTYTHLGLEAAQNEMVRLEELNRAKEEVVKAVGELSTAYKRPQTMKGGHEW